MSEWVAFGTAEQLVRHWLRFDLSADEIERRLKDDPLWRHASVGDRSTCKRLLTYRRLYDNAAADIIAAGKYPSAEKIAEKIGKDERTVRRWQHGEET